MDVSSSMGMRITTKVVLVSILVTSCLGMVSKYPCPPNRAFNKANTDGCVDVALPPGLCDTCYLNDWVPSGNQKGSFKACNNIYNKNPQCLVKMNDYVKNNPCDNPRKILMNKITAGTATNGDYYNLDYFIYSVCEQCCDCIAMDAVKGKDNGLWVTTRGNCPAHAYYDICGVLPKVKNFRKIGQPKLSQAQLNNLPLMCGELTGWFNSPAKNNWWNNPVTQISPALDGQTAKLLEAIECSKPAIWNRCFDLEAAQSNIQGLIANGGGNPKPTPTPTPSPSKKPSGTGTNPGGCSGAVRWTCLKQSPITGCCEDPGCKCFPNEPKNTVPDSCYKWGKYPKPGVGYDLDNCSGHIKWGCLDRYFGGDNCGWKCRKWGCACFPFDPVPPGPPNWCTQQAQNNQQGAALQARSIGDGNSTSKSGSMSCFPDEAEVTTPNGPMAMARLRVGDVVLAKPGVYSPVFMFSHQDGPASTEMLQITTKTGRVLTLSPGHHVLVGDIELAASKLRRGDTLHTVDGDEQIASISLVVRTGLYNPHTVSGTIVVDGVVCSTYTEHVHHYAAHALLSPIRALWLSGVVPLDTMNSVVEYGVTTSLW